MKGWNVILESLFHFQAPWVFISRKIEKLGQNKSVGFFSLEITFSKIVQRQNEWPLNTRFASSHACILLLSRKIIKNLHLFLLAHLKLQFVPGVCMSYSQSLNGKLFELGIWACVLKVTRHIRPFVINASCLGLSVHGDLKTLSTCPPFQGSTQWETFIL